MSVRISGHQLKITAEMRDYIESKLPRIEKYTDRIQSLEVVLEKDGKQILAELRLKAGPIDVTAKQKDHDAMKAVDLLIDKVEIQLKKKWDKLRGKKKGLTVPNRNAKKADLDGPEAGMDARATGRSASVKPSISKIKSAGGRASNANDRANRNGVGNEENTYPVMLDKLNVRVFPSERHAIDHMTVEEAAEELFFKDENFFCFINQKTNTMNVVYRRKDGNFAVIVPETE